jgi:hypothetical protein
MAMAADPPLMKEGYWSIHTSTIENPGNKKTESKQTICRSHAYEEYLRNQAKNRKGCKILLDSYTSTMYTQEVDCVVGATTIHGKSVTTWQGDSATHTETRSTNSPALYGVSETLMTMDQKFLGACPAGVQPGDLVHPDGSKSNSWKR